MLINNCIGNKLIAISFYSLIFFLFFDYIFAFTIYKSQMAIYFFMFFNMLTYVYCAVKYGTEKYNTVRLWSFYIVIHILSLTINWNISTVPYWVVALIMLYIPSQIVGVFKPNIFIYIGLFFANGVFFQYLFPDLYYVLVFPLFIGDSSEFIESSIIYEFGFSGFTPQTTSTAYFLLICLSITLAFKKNQSFFKKSWVTNFIIIIFLLAIFLTGKRMASVISVLLILACVFFSRKTNLSRKILLFVVLIIVGYFLLQYFIANTDQFSDSAFLKRFAGSIEKASAGDDISSGRDKLYERAWALWSSEPILGIGANNFSKISGMGTSVHNTYLQVLCEEGLLLFPLFIIPLVMVFCRTIKLLHKEITSETKNYLVLSFLFQIVFILYSFSGNTIVNYNNFVFYFMGVGLFAYASRNRTKS